MNVRMMRLTLTVSCLLGGGCLGDLKPDVGKRIDGDGSPADEDGEGNPRDGEPGDGTPDGGDGEPMSDAGTQGDAGGEGDAGGDGASDEDAAVGPVPGCDMPDTDPRRAVSFKDDIMPILAVCSCHDPKSDDIRGILDSGLTIDGYASLRKGGDNSFGDVVIARNPCDSIMLQKLSTTPPFGERMPLDGPYLSEQERTLIADWIVEGAHDN